MISHSQDVGAVHPIAKALTRIGKDQAWLAGEIKRRGGKCGAAMISHVVLGKRGLSDENKRLIADILGGGSMLFELTEWQPATPDPAVPASSPTAGEAA